MLFFQPSQPATIDMEDFLHEINSWAVPSQELKCGEYCFHHHMNPFQHPSLDRNIHHLTALLRALSKNCGGVVQLSTSERTMLKGREFNSFKSRLLSLPGICETVLETTQTGNDTSWAIIAAKKCQEKLFCFDSSYMKLCIDINGQLLQEKCNQNGGQEVLNNPGEALKEEETQDPEQNGLADVDDSPPSKIPKLSTVDKVGEVETIQAPADFSTLNELNWDENKKNWRESLITAKQSPESIIDSCDIWEPRLPMQMTPDRDSLKRLFLSDAECWETISKLETKTPGFAIASRTWTSFLLESGHLQRPPGHLCDILTVAKHEGLKLPQPSICLWVIVSSTTEHTILRQVEYMFTLGRRIKYQLSVQSSEVPNLAIQCMLHSTRAEDCATIEHTLRQLGIQDMQEFVCSAFGGKGHKAIFAGIRKSIALLLLSQESPIKTCAGNQLSVKLSAQQTQTLLQIKSRKVSYVSSAPGTGKTLCGLALYRDFGRDYSVYICPTEPLLHYLRYNGCEATLVRNDEDLYQHMKSGTFDNKVCVIIDESHRLKCSKASLRELFMLMKKHRMRLFVFADNAYQSFERENQLQIQTYIYELSRVVWGLPPYEPILTEIYRNTRKVVSFLQHAMGYPDSDSEDVLDITCGNAYEGDGIHCIAMGNLVDNQSDNAFVQYLNQLLDTRYQVNEVAVLLDSGYTDDHIDAMRQVLQTHIPRVTTHSAATYPREGIIVDRAERFAGLDAALCIFLLSIGTATNPDATIENPRYRVYLASRATHKAVFIVPRINADIVQHMKFDYFQVRFISFN